MMNEIWSDFLAERDHYVYSNAGFGEETKVGNNPAFVIVDVTYGFTGEKADSIEEAIKEYPTSCGPESWEAVNNIKQLLENCRELNIPIYYTVIEGSDDLSNKNVAVKGEVFNHPSLREGKRGSQIVDEIKPKSGEVVLSKKKPSAFFGTPLLSYLINENIDTLIVTGATTSGCIRSTVIDAFSHNYNVFVPENCVFDRGIASHAINLFDMQQKYADVTSSETLIQQLHSVIK